MIDEVLLMRHGRTAYNLDRRLQGQINTPLDIIGQWQVDQSAYALAQTYYWAKASNIAAHPELLMQSDQPLAYDSDSAQYEQSPAAQRRMIVISSDLFRAQQTAHAFADIMGLPVSLDAGLRERAFGQWEGLTREEIQDKFPEGYRAWRAHSGEERVYGVESRREVGNRGRQALTALVQSYASDPQPTTVLAVSHGSWISATIATLLGLNPESMDELGAMRNAFWSTIHVTTTEQGIQWRVDQYNQGPRIAQYVDWENGPDNLRNPQMPVWKTL